MLKRTKVVGNLQTRNEENKWHRSRSWKAIQHPTAGIRLGGYPCIHPSNVYQSTHVHSSSPRACWIYPFNVYVLLYFPVCTRRGEAPAHKEDEEVEARNTGQEDGRWLVGGLSIRSGWDIL